MATSLPIDTQQFVEDLKLAGFTNQQAVGLTKAIQKSDLSQLVTKSDLKAELKDLELRITNRMLVVAGVQVALLALLISYLQLA